ncbi:MAG: isoprenylcysteine carboxylmethyltransferase family protein [Dehalococcoidia bacterium]|jgi:protein-S-isoprenylcysteine O-methyltransferase Ste14|nr:isoprenylcysteine carboxylmethyltransferase family protein [Dehalococcoidia bacterium]
MASPRLVFGLPFGAGVVLHVMTGSDIEAGGSLIAVVLGAVSVGVGLVLAAWATITLLRRGEHPDPARPTTTLVMDGPYGYTRNPIYLSFTAVGLGIGLLLNSYWVAGSVPIAVLALRFLVITREERYLETVIGQPYAAYRESVRRWL